MNRRRFVASALAGAVGVAGLGTATGARAGNDVAFTYNGDAITLAPESDQTVTGSTEFGSGVELTVRLRSSGSSPFIRSTETTVDDDGSFAATFDLSDVDVGTEFTASVSWHRYEQAEAPGEVVAVDPELSLDVDDEVLSLAPATGQTIAGDTDLPEGQTVSLRLQSQRGEVFIKQTTTTVDADGSFTATVDMSGLDAGTMFLVEAYYADRRQTFAIGELAD